MKICNHCGTPIALNLAGKKVECNHVYYPECCKHCSSASSYQKTIIDYDMSKITTEVEGVKLDTN
jgi:hypothetical protein